MNDERVTAIMFEVCMGQKFADWYEEKFIPYISGEDGCLDKGDCMNELLKIVSRYV